VVPIRAAQSKHHYKAQTLPCRRCNLSTPCGEQLRLCNDSSPLAALEAALRSPQPLRLSSSSVQQHIGMRQQLQGTGNSSSSSSSSSRGSDSAELYAATACKHYWPDKLKPLSGSLLRLSPGQCSCCKLKPYPKQQRQAGGYYSAPINTSIPLAVRAASCRPAM
jgi:hypothetical protein